MEKPKFNKVKIEDLKEGDRFFMEDSDEISFVTKKGLTFLHSHTYIKISTLYVSFITNKLRKITYKIYFHRNKGKYVWKFK